MSDYPRDFAPATQPLPADRLSRDDADLVARLAEKGYEFHVGLSEKYANDIMRMCLQPSIKEYCPNDSGRRFKDLEATRHWLAKGRAAFLLLKQDSLELAGYGWAGPETSPFVPGAQTTFAIRIGEADQGRGLSTPFLRLIIAGAAILYQARDVWLETWASDAAAVHIYHKLGCVDVGQVDDDRPTASGDTVKDMRLYMTLPNELL